MQRLPRTFLSLGMGKKNDKPARLVTKDNTESLMDTALTKRVSSEWPGVHKVPTNSKHR